PAAVPLHLWRHRPGHDAGGRKRRELPCCRHRRPGYRVRRDEHCARACDRCQGRADGSLSGPPDDADLRVARPDPGRHGAGRVRDHDHVHGRAPGRIPARGQPARLARRLRVDAPDRVRALLGRGRDRALAEDDRGRKLDRVYDHLSADVPQQCLHPARVAARVDAGIRQEPALHALCGRRAWPADRIPGSGKQGLACDRLAAWAPGGDGPVGDPVAGSPRPGL
ncbi:MAG: Efflux ABC transporter, permease protein, partial [uncultured Thermomicrobiales bacterium]